MAPGDSTSSPRDHAADSNPELARKKQRMSEDRGASPSDSIIIEADEPEDVGTNMENAIEIEDGVSSVFESYSDDFLFLSNFTPPVEQVRELHGQIKSNFYLKPSLFHVFVQKLDDHIDRTADDASEWQQRYIDEEAEFFNELMSFAHAVLQAGDLFDPKDKINHAVLRLDIEKFLLGYGTLCRRIISFLPDAIKNTLSRRDSAQNSARQHQISSLFCTVVANQVITAHGQTLKHASIDYKLNLTHLSQKVCSQVCTDGVISPLAAIIRLLSGAMREIKDSWWFLNQTLAVFNMAVSTCAASGHYPKDEVESVMEIINACVLPIIREKHPRALPDHFHNDIIHTGESLLSHHVAFVDTASIANAFRCLVSSPSDALIPEPNDDDSVEMALQRVCDRNPKILAVLIADSWAMQTAKSFLCSDIMDIRTIGVASLQMRLVDIYNKWKDTPDGFEHPIIQHAVRFLRKNEIIPYMLGPESRAALLHQGADIITFLAATQTFTDSETDIIWRACSGSVEADFVKAAFQVLWKIKEFAEFERLLYIAKKYTTTPMASFGVDATNYLSGLLKDIDLKSSSNPADRLAIITLSVEVLKNSNCGDSTQAKDRLRQVAMNEISRSAYPPFDSDDRAHIYKICVPDILNHSAHATSAIEVLDIMIQSITQLEAEHLLTMLPISAVADELCGFVRTQKQHHAHNPKLHGIIPRLDFLGNLVAFSSAPADSSIQERLFAHLVGAEAISNQARNMAWERLEYLARSANAAPAISNLFNIWMWERVPSLPVELATRRLIDQVSMCLRMKVASIQEEMRGDLKPLLSLSLWQTLVRFATSAPDDAVVKAAIDLIMNFLFTFPINAQLRAEAAIQCQSEFAKTLVVSLSTLHEIHARDKTSEALRHYGLAMNVLDAVFECSKNFPTDQSSSDSKVLDIKDDQDDSTSIEFIAQVYGLKSEPKKIKVSARDSTKVSMLLRALPDLTATTENRVVAGGVEITEMPEKTLYEAGVRHSGVILIRPKYSYTVNLDQVLTRPGPVEEAILSEYSALEALLDGPEETAHRTLLFLRKLRIPSQSRSRVVSSSTAARELFPSNRRNRGYFSLFVMKTHLLDFARIGVVDRDFILSATQRLTAFLLDKQRAFDPFLMYEVLDTLCLVLRERPKGNEDLQYFEDGSNLTSRLIDTLFDIKSLPLGGPLLPLKPLPRSEARKSPIAPPRPLRNELAATAYRTLILAYQVSDTVWTAFTSSEAGIKLHEQLLLDEDVHFSAVIANSMESFFDDPEVTRGLQDHYWQLIYPSLSEALAKSHLSESYFAVVNKILDGIEMVQYDETWIRSLVESLIPELFNYQHTECPPLLTGDRAMVGLLRLFSTAVRVLKKKYKGSPTLDRLSPILFRRLLFPSPNDADCRPLVQAESRSIVYDLVKSTLAPEMDFEQLVELSIGACQTTNRAAEQNFPGMSEWIRPASHASGLTNLGMTCYMNSLLQQLFGNLQFRKFIMDQDIEDPQKQATLIQLQQLFASMQNGVRPWADTGNLAVTLGVQVGIQEDVHTFYTTLLSRLEDSMPDKESRQALQSFFTGKSVTQIKGDCGHVSSREEAFTELSITVKNKAGLYDSLSEFVQGEPLEGSNKYMCMSCASDDNGRLVNAMKRTCLEEVPNSLTVCLKRFAFENMFDVDNKVNDRFEFPSEIDMSLYNRKHLEDPDAPRTPDPFELVGVIVHQGSLSYGHYWSYVRTPAPSHLYPTPWMHLEDSRYLPCNGGVQEVQEQCFGGAGNALSERSDNAYVLFYQRKSYVAETDSINLVPRFLQMEQQTLPAVNVQDRLLKEVDHSNDWLLRIAALFNDQFTDFLKMLLEQYNPRAEATRNAIDALEETDETKPDLEKLGYEMDARVAELIVTAALRIYVPNPACDSKIPKLMKVLNDIVRSNPKMAAHILRYFAQDDFGFHTIVAHPQRSAALSHLFGFIGTCLATMQQHKHELYDETALMVIKAHASLLTHNVPVPDRYPPSWKEYFGFATQFAKLGPQETRMVLERGYLHWIFEALYFNADVKLRKKHLALFNNTKHNFVDRSPLLEFIYSLLSGYVDLSAGELRLSDEREFTSKGWRMYEDEIENLFLMGQKEKKTALLFEQGVTHCTSKNIKWRDFAPGKLVAFLISQTENEAVSSRARDCMRIQYDLEETELEPLLYMTLHIFLGMKDDESSIHICKNLMEVLCKNLLLWQTRERRSLWFLREANYLAPEVVAHSVPLWACTFLTVDNPQTRMAASSWMKDILFGPTPMLDTSLAGTIICSTRSFIKQSMETLRTGYDNKKSRARYESMITSLGHAKDYLAALEGEIQQQEEQGVDISQKVVVEFNETRPVLAQLEEFMEQLNRLWKPDITLPARTFDVRKSVEADEQVSDEDETSDAELDDLSEEFGD